MGTFSGPYSRPAAFAGWNVELLLDSIIEAAPLPLNVKVV